MDAVALIDSMLMLNPNERLGSPGTTCGIENLKNHPFFKGVDFAHPKSLSLTDHHRSLITGEAKEVSRGVMAKGPQGQRKSLFMLPSEVGYAENIICRGFLLKKNRWFQKQVRYFQLFQTGELKYFKDIKKYKGKIMIGKGTKVVKTAKN